jgi:hypothetical protein
MDHTGDDGLSSQPPFISRDEYDFRVEIVTTLRDLKGSIDTLNTGLRRLEDLPDRMRKLEADHQAAQTARDVEQQANRTWQSWVQPVLMLLILAVLTLLLTSGPAIVAHTNKGMVDSVTGR